MSAALDLTGQYLGNWRVIERGPNDRWGDSRWWSECQCSHRTVALVRAVNLTRGLSTRCLHCNNRSRQALDRCYFHQIDTADKAYILGFVTADGCVQPPYYVSISQRKDPEVLTWILRAMGCETRVPQYNPKLNIHQVRLCGRQLVADLQRLGLCARKTYADCPFPPVGSEFWAPFILGVLDGDGCITRCKNNHRPSDSWWLTFVGTPALLTGIRDILARTCQTSPRARVFLAKPWLHRLEYGGNRQVERIDRWLYETNPPDYCLSRKKAVFLALQEARAIRSAGGT